MFELAVALFFTQNHNNIKINQFALFNGKKKEIDVTAETSSDIFFVECKAYKNPVKIEVVSKWIDEKLPIIRDAYKDKEDGNAKKMHFEFWSTSGFEQDALNFLIEQKGNSRKYEIDFYDKTQILQKAYDSRFPKLKEIFKDYFEV